MAGHARKNFGHMGNPFVHGGNRCCPREANGFGGGAVWLWRLREMVLPHEGTMIGAGDRGDERDEAGACGADDKLLISV